MYRIVEETHEDNSISYKVQRRSFFIWSTVSTYCGSYGSPCIYRRKEDAEERIEKFKQEEVHNNIIQSKVISYH